MEATTSEPHGGTTTTATTEYNRFNDNGRGFSGGGGVANVNVDINDDDALADWAMESNHNLANMLALFSAIVFVGSCIAFFDECAESIASQSAQGTAAFLAPYLAIIFTILILYSQTGLMSIVYRRRIQGPILKKYRMEGIQIMAQDLKWKYRQGNNPDHLNTSTTSNPPPTTVEEHTPSPLVAATAETPLAATTTTPGTETQQAVAGGQSTEELPRGHNLTRTKNSILDDIIRSYNNSTRSLEQQEPRSSSTPSPDYNRYDEDDDDDNSMFHRQVMNTKCSGGSRIVMVYQPDRNDVTTQYTKEVFVRQDEQVSECDTDFLLLVLPGIPTSAILKQRYEKISEVDRRERELFRYGLIAPILWVLAFTYAICMEYFNQADSSFSGLHWALVWLVCTSLLSSLFWSYSNTVAEAKEWIYGDAMTLEEYQNANRSWLNCDSCEACHAVACFEMV